MLTNIKMKNDGQLLAEFSTGRKEEAFEELIRRHGRLVFNVCRRVLNNSHDAEDAMQAVFLTLAHKASQMKGYASIAAWLHHVAWCVASDARKAATFRRKHESEAGNMAQKASESEPDREWEALRPLLDRELDALPEKYRLPILLHFVEGWSVEESAQLLGWKTGTFASRLGRGKEVLKDRLARRGAVLSVGLLAALISGHASAAELPSTFTAITVKAAGFIAAGNAAAGGGIVSTQAIALTQGAMKMLFLMKLNAAAAWVIGALLFSAVGFTAYHAMAEDETNVVANQDESKSGDPKSKANYEKNKGIAVSGISAHFSRRNPQGSDPFDLSLTLKNIGKDQKAIPAIRMFNKDHESSQWYLIFERTDVPDQSPLKAQYRGLYTQPPTMDLVLDPNQEIVFERRKGQFLDHFLNPSKWMFSSDGTAWKALIELPPGGYVVRLAFPLDGKEVVTNSVEIEIKGKGIEGVKNADIPPSISYAGSRRSTTWIEVPEGTIHIGSKIARVAVGQGIEWQGVKAYLSLDQCLVAQDAQREKTLWAKDLGKDGSTHMTFKEVEFLPGQKVWAIELGHEIGPERRYFGLKTGEELKITGTEKEPSGASAVQPNKQTTKRRQ